MNRLREFRKAKGLNQEELADLCDCISQTAISKHEAGEKFIADLNKLGAMAKILECPTADLIEPNLHVKPQSLLDLLQSWVRGSGLDAQTTERLYLLIDLIRKDLPRDAPQK